MAVLPGNTAIEYQNVEPRQTTNLARVVPVNTGAEAIERGMAQLSRGFEAVSEAQMATDFSTRQRLYDHLTFDAHQKFANTGDPIERAKIKDQWSKDTQQQVFTTNNAFLRKPLNEWGNKVLERDGQTFATTELGIQHKNVLDGAQTNIEAKLGLGMLNDKDGEAGVYTEYAKLHAMFPEKFSEAWLSEKIKDAPNESLLKQAENAIGNNQGQTAIGFLSQAKDMNIQQTERHHKLEAWAKQVGKKTADEAKVSAVDLMNQNENGLGADKEKISQQIGQSLKDAGVSGDDYLQWMGPQGVTERWKAGKYEQDNPEQVSQIDRDIRDASLGQQRRSDVDDYIRKAVVDGFLTPKTAAEKLKTNYDDFKKYQNNAVKKEVDFAENILIPKKRTAADMSVDEMLNTENAVVDTAQETSKRTEGYAKLQWVDEQLRDFVKNSPNSTEAEIYVQGKRIIAAAQRDTKSYVPEYFVYNDEDYVALPHGAKFHAPDGRLMRKP